MTGASISSGQWPDGDGVRHVDLEDGVSPPHEAQYPGMTVYWQGDRPIGHILVPPLPQDGREAARVVAQTRDLRLPPRTDLTSSIVICTRNRPEELARCLAALPHQTCQPNEIIVVDNASWDSRVRDLATAAGAVYVREDRIGLDYARNAGARRASSDIVAYTDDDVVLHSRWLERLVTAFDGPDILAVTGLVLPGELATDAQFYFERFWSLSRGYDPVLFDSVRFRRDVRTAFPVWEIGAGANMAFRRVALLAAGGFDERLDAGQAGCSGDSEMWHRLLAAGGSCRYEPCAVAFHHHRRSGQDLARQIFFYMRGHVAALLVQYERSGRRADLGRVCRHLPVAYLKRVWRVSRGRAREEDRYLRQEVLGFCSGLLFYYRRRLWSPV